MFPKVWKFKGGKRDGEVLTNPAGLAPDVVMGDNFLFVNPDAYIVAEIDWDNHTVIYEPIAFANSEDESSNQ